MSKTVLFQTIQFSLSTQFRPTQLNVNTVLFQTIQFSVITPAQPLRAQSGSGSNDKEGVLHIPQSSNITGASVPDAI